MPVDPGIRSGSVPMFQTVRVIELRETIKGFERSPFRTIASPDFSTWSSLTMFRKHHQGKRADSDRRSSVAIGARATAHALFAAFAMAALPTISGCKQQTPAAENVVLDTTATAGAKREERETTQGVARMTVLNQLLVRFASTDGVRWQSYDGLQGVEWTEAQPIETPEVSDPSARFSRSGKMTLAGFGETDLPDGRIGADADTRRGNEGESGVTLSGDADRVNAIVVMKFYPNEDYESVLSKQFAAATLVPEASRCALDFGTKAENTGKNSFYRIEIDGAPLAHVEAYVDEESGPSGPGSTTFVFYRSKPGERIATMQCQEQRG
jgi:hypothetical protein